MLEWDGKQLARWIEATMESIQKGADVEGASQEGGALAARFCHDFTPENLVTWLGFVDAMNNFHAAAEAEAVLVATPNVNHRQTARSQLEAERHILVEKTISDSVI